MKQIIICNKKLKTLTIMITANKNIMLTVIVCASVVCRPCCCRLLSEERIKIGVGVSFP